ARLWSDALTSCDSNLSMAFAESAPSFYVLTHTVNGTTKRNQLRKYGVVSSTPQWIADFSPVIPAGQDYWKIVIISKDGQKIFAVFLSVNESRIYIYTFAPGSNAPLGAPKIVTAPGLIADAFISDDGSRILVRTSSMVYVFDTSTWATLANFVGGDSGVK